VLFVVSEENSFVLGDGGFSWVFYVVFGELGGDADTHAIAA